ncbi:MAG: T9SS type A sorting domain-containing protein [Bacteroidales bacterium]|nr:T9SS type A sorting domain-containing protein [Bacteroidales bacterium]
MVYYKKDGVEWGTPLDFTVNTTLQPIAEKPEVISVFPNPANDKVNIVFKNNTGEFSLQITDHSGREIAAYSIDGEANTLDLSNLKPGMYLLRFITDNQTFIKKLLKQ